MCGTKTTIIKKTEKKNKLERDRNSIKRGLCLFVFISFVSTLVTKVICFLVKKKLETYEAISLYRIFCMLSDYRPPL